MIFILQGQNEDCCESVYSIDFQAAVGYNSCVMKSKMILGVLDNREKNLNIENPVGSNHV